MFRPLHYVIFMPSGKTNPRAIYISMRYRSPNAYRLCYMNVKYTSLYILESVYPLYTNLCILIHIK